MMLLVTLERDETGMIVAECPSIPGCVSQGATESEALENVREAIAGAWKRAGQTTCRSRSRLTKLRSGCSGHHDKKLRDKMSGKLLWETILPYAGNATPAMYEVNGKQYIVVPAGGGRGHPSGGSLVAFAVL